MSLWNCTTCFKSFARKGDLTRHESQHTGIKPHVCETCGRGFAQFSGLKTHRNVHSKAKPYNCGIGTCTKAFGDPSSRTRHRKETHRREGAYKCIITHCGTRIKRRSAFMAHLRKHGLDPNSLHLDAIVPQSAGGGISTPAHPASPAVESESHHKARYRNVAPAFLDDSRVTPFCSKFSANCSKGSGYHTSGDGGKTSNFMDSNRSLDHGPLDCRRAGWSPANDALLLDPTLDQAVKVGPPGLGQLPSVSFKNSFCLDGVFSTTVNCPRLAVSPLNLPALESEAGSDRSQSSSTSTSPASTFLALYTTEFNDDVASQESLLYNIV